MGKQMDFERCEIRVYKQAKAKLEQYCHDNDVSINAVVNILVDGLVDGVITLEKIPRVPVKPMRIINVRALEQGRVGVKMANA